MGKIADVLLKKKKKVDEAEAQVNRLEGREQTLFDELSKKFGISTVAQAEKKLEALGKSIDTDEATLRQGLADLDADYEWE